MQALQQPLPFVLSTKYSPICILDSSTCMGALMNVVLRSYPANYASGVLTSSMCLGSRNVAVPLTLSWLCGVPRLKSLMQAAEASGLTRVDTNLDNMFDFGSTTAPEKASAAHAQMALHAVQNIPHKVFYGLSPLHQSSPFG